MNASSKNGFLFGLLMPGDLRAREEWETLFEGDVTFTAYPASDPYSAWNNTAVGKNVLSGVADGESVRLTIDGQSKVYPVNSQYAGNQYLSNGVSDVDDGFGLYVACGGRESSAILPPYTYLYAYNIGTYTVKIERAVS